LVVRVFLTINKYLINTHYRLGMTGSAFRTDGETLKMIGVCGNIIYTKQTEELIKEGYKAKQNFIMDDFDPVEKIPKGIDIKEEDRKKVRWISSSIRTKPSKRI